MRLIHNDYRNVITDQECTGCEACKSSCPEHCIEMIWEKGFLYPQIDKDRCISCNKCRKVCPQNGQIIQTNNEDQIYWGYDRNRSRRLSATSGGIFGVLAEMTLNSGRGVVFGVEWDDSGVARVGWTTTPDELIRFKKSKYVQAQIGDAYKKVKEYLDEGYQVLYSGTACAIGGLKAFLGKAYDNLITIDVICHGVPSPLIFSKYKSSMEQQLNCKINAIDFRYKDLNHGWNEEFKKMTLSDGRVIIGNSEEDCFFRLFLDNYITRKSCFCCKYKNNYPSDITLGDYWLSEEFCGIDDNEGISVFVAHTAKGNEMVAKFEEGNVCVQSGDWGILKLGNLAYYESVPLNKYCARYMERALVTRNWLKYTHGFINRCERMKKLKHRVLIWIKAIRGND